MKIPPPAPAPNLSEILAYAFWMRKQGCRPSTIQAAVSTLKAVAKKANLLNPEAVKAHLASREVSVGRKEKICLDLARFYRFKQIPFQMPRYQRIDTIPFVPQEKEVDQLISACGKKTATFLQLLKETGIRPGEAWAPRWRDVDFERASVTITPEKGSNARQLRASNRLIAILNALVALLATSGLRIGEAANLRIGNVDLDNGRVIMATRTKSRATRITFISKEAAKFLRDYLRKRLNEKDAWLFPDLQDKSKPSLGCSFVAERSLIPNPAAGTTTFLKALADEMITHSIYCPILSRSC